MAKKPVVSAAILILAAQVLTVEGEVVSRTAAGITIRNKKPKSPKMRDTFVPNADLIAIYTGEDSTLVSYRAVAEYDTVVGAGGEINDFGMIEVEAESGTVEINPAVASVGSVDAEGEAEAPAKAKGKKAAAEEVEPDYEPEEGDRVTITDGEEDVYKGTISAMTAKTVTITDKAGEEHKFKWDEINIEKAPAAKGKPKAAAAEEDEPAPAKPKAGKPAAGKKPAADAGDDW